LCTISFLMQADCLEWFLCQSGSLKTKKLKSMTFYYVFIFCQYYQYGAVYLQDMLWSSVSQRTPFFWSGICYRFTQPATVTGADPRIPLKNVKSEWTFPIPLLLVLRLQLELGASGVGPLPQTAPSKYNRTTQHPIPKSSHLILVGGLLIS